MKSICDLISRLLFFRADDNSNGKSTNEPNGIRPGPAKRPGISPAPREGGYSPRQSGGCSRGCWLRDPLNKLTRVPRRVPAVSVSPPCPMQERYRTITQFERAHRSSFRFKLHFIVIAVLSVRPLRKSLVLF